MTMHTFSPVTAVASNDFYNIVVSPRQSVDKTTKLPKPALYAAFSLAIPKAYIQAYTMPSWDTSGYFVDAILDAIKEKAIQARTEKKPGLDLPDRLPEFVASLSVGGRINKEDLVAWLETVAPFIAAYVQDRKPSASALQQSAMVATLTAWASRGAAPAPGWDLPQWESLSRLTTFLSDLSEAAEPGEFPQPAMLESLTKKVAGSKPKLTTSEAI